MKRRPSPDFVVQDDVHAEPGVLELARRIEEIGHLLYAWERNFIVVADRVDVIRLHHDRAVGYITEHLVEFDHEGLSRTSRAAPR